MPSKKPAPKLTKPHPPAPSTTAGATGRPTSRPHKLGTAPKTARVPAIRPRITPQQVEAKIDWTLRDFVKAERDSTRQRLNQWTQEHPGEEPPRVLFRYMRTAPNTLAGNYDDGALKAVPYVEGVTAIPTVEGRLPLDSAIPPVANGEDVATWCEKVQKHITDQDPRAVWAAQGGGPVFQSGQPVPGEHEEACHAASVVDWAGHLAEEWKAILAGIRPTEEHKALLQTLVRDAYLFGELVSRWEHARYLKNIRDNRALEEGRRHASKSLVSPPIKQYLQALVYTAQENAGVSHTEACKRVEGFLFPRRKGGVCPAYKGQSSLRTIPVPSDVLRDQKEFGIKTFGWEVIRKQTVGRK